jgi:hypothetical protein
MSGAFNKGTFVWSPEALEMLRAAHTKGDSMQSIASSLSKAFRMPISKSAICGKVFRLKLQRPDAFVPNTRGQGAKARKPPAEKPARPKAAEHDAASQRRLRDMARVEASKIAPAPEPTLKARNSDALALEPKGIMALGHSCCRWPLNMTADDGSVLFCGNDRGSARPYCPGHAQRASIKTRSPEQAAADAKTWAANVKRAGVNTKATRHFNTPLEIAA